MVKTYKVELANKIGRINGRVCAVGNLWGVAEYRNGCRGGYVLAPQADESLARETCSRLNLGQMSVVA